MARRKSTTKVQRADGMGSVMKLSTAPLEVKKAEKKKAICPLFQYSLLSSSVSNLIC